MTAQDLAWVAGFLEGEGSFGFTLANRHLRVKAIQVQRWPLDILHNKFGGTLHEERRAHLNPKWSDAVTWSIIGKTAAGLMMTIFPLMSPKRQGQIRKALSHWRSRKPAAEFRRTCPQGHPYDAANTARYGKGERVCRTCCRVRTARARDARRSLARVVRVGGLLVMILSSASCAHSLGYAGKNPGAVECYGKATITGSGQGALAMGYSGTETNAFTLTFDCGDKAGFKQYNPNVPESGGPSLPPR